MEQIATCSDDLRKVKAMRDRFSSSYRKNLIVTARSVHRVGALQGRWPQNGVMLVKTPGKRMNRRCRCRKTPSATCSMSAAPPKSFGWSIPGHSPAPGSGSRRRCATNTGCLGVFGSVVRRRGRWARSPIHPRLQLAKEAILACSPHSAQALHDAAKRMRRRTGIYFHAHQFRKSFAQAMLDREAAWITVQKLLGHTLGVTGVYANPNSRQMQEAVAKLPF